MAEGENEPTRADPLSTVIYERGSAALSAGDLLAACRAQVEGALDDARHKYVPWLYVRRAVQDELDVFLKTRPGEASFQCFLVVAPAGSGKTSLLCEVARVNAARRPVLLLPGGQMYVGTKTGLAGGLQVALQSAGEGLIFGSAADALEILCRLGEALDQDVLLLLDAIDEHEPPARMRKALEEWSREAQGRRLKLVLTCRDVDWPLFEGALPEGTAIHGWPAAGSGETSAAALGRFTGDEAGRALDLYLDRYEVIGRPAGDVAAACRHPLFLRFLCEVYRGQVLADPGPRLKDLFDRYWEQRFPASTGEGQVQDTLLDVAAHMARHHARALSLDELAGDGTPDSPAYRQICDEHLILEEWEQGRGRQKETRVSFVYGEFGEYTMARALLRDWERDGLDEGAILAELEALLEGYACPAQGLGLAGYLGAMLEERRGLSPWSLLLRGGERWRPFVLAAARRLPEAHLDGGLLDALGELLSAGDEETLVAALGVLQIGRLAQAAPAPLLERLLDLASGAPEPVRRRALLALAGTGQNDLALPVFAEAVTDPRKSIRQAAVAGLLALGDARAARLLVGALQDVDTEVRQEASEALAGLGVPAISSLIAALGDGDPELRRRVAGALGELRPRDAALARRVVESLVVAMEDHNEGVRRGAARALARLDEAAKERFAAALARGDWQARRGAAQTLKKLAHELGDAAPCAWIAEPLLSALEDRDWRVRRMAVEVLGKVGDGRAVMPLIERLEDRNLAVQREAAAVLGKMGDERAVQPLIAALQRGYGGVQQRAADALVELGEPAVEPLVALLEHPDRGWAHRARATLGALGPWWMAQPTLALQGHVLEALRRIGTPEALLAVRVHEEKGPEGG